MNVKETFLRLTTHTTPHKKEKEYLSKLLPMDILKEDPVGNLFVKIGDSNTMFAAHLDTVGGNVPIKHVIEGNIIKTDGKSVLGADDKSGVVILLYMIEAGIPGMYTFFLGEEVGCVGSIALSSWVEKNKNNEDYKNINKVVSFDRKDVDSVITHQLSERCCSDEFADSLIKELGTNGLKFRKDTGGVLTDSVHFTDLYAECTNLSVGYWSQHTNVERQDIDFLEKLCVASTKVKWDELTIKRKPGETERLSYGRNSVYSGGGRGSYSDWDEHDYGNYYGGGTNFEWNNTGRNVTHSSSSKSGTGEYVKDWRGDQVKSKDAVWCEFDKQHCLKTEAIWVDLLGFYTTPDESTKRKTTTSGGDADAGKVFKSNNTPEIHGNDITIGMEIVHPTFGKGEVMSKTPEGKKIEVNFEKSGRKTLLASVAKIKKV